MNVLRLNEGHMKFIITLLAIWSCSFINGQISMFVHQNNSSTDNYNIDNVRKITFDNGMNVHPNTGAITNYMIDDIRKLTFEPGVFTQIGNLQNSTLAFNAYPNPTSDNINIEYTLNNESDIEFSLFNIKGDLIKNLEVSSIPVGPHTFQFDLSKNNISPGIYIMHLRTSNSIQSSKIIVK